MNPLDLAYINRLAPYKVWTENGRNYLVETSYDLLFKVTGGQARCYDIKKIIHDDVGIRI